MWSTSHGDASAYRKHGILGGEGKREAILRSDQKTQKHSGSSSPTAAETQLSDGLGGGMKRGRRAEEVRPEVESVLKMFMSVPKTVRSRLPAIENQQHGQKDGQLAS